MSLKLERSIGAGERQLALQHQRHRFNHQALSSCAFSANFAASHSWWTSSVSDSVPFSKIIIASPSPPAVASIIIAGSGFCHQQCLRQQETLSSELTS
jgi:hypothetical protein